LSAVSCIACGQIIPADLPGSGTVCPHCGVSQIATPAAQVGTQPNLLLAAAIAGVCAAAFYGIGPWLLLRDTPLYHLFCGHGWVPYALVTLFFVALCALLLKLPLIQREQTAFSLRLLPEEAEGVIEQADSRHLLSRIGRLTPRQKSLMVVIRVRQTLLRLHQLGTAEKLDDLLRYRAEADAAAVDSSYALPKFIIWAIPVLGFVGTVLGISNGVQSFSTLIQNAADLEGLRESLKGVTYGLGQAFETTMIALCMSLLLMLVMSFLQRREDRLLAELDEYCMEHLLHKIRTPAAIPEDAMAALTSAVRELSQRCRDLQAVQEEALRNLADVRPAAAPSPTRVVKQS